MPLINKRFANLLAGPSEAWEDIIIPTNQLHSPMYNALEEPDCKAIQRWLLFRAGYVTDLRMIFDNCPPLHLIERGPFDRSFLLRAALGTDTARLRVLHLDTAVVKISTSTLTGLLHMAVNLEEFKLDFGGDYSCHPDCCGAIMDTLSQLPLLQRVSVISSVATTLEEADYPTKVQLAALSGKRITTLAVELVDEYPIKAVKLGNLPGLLDCTLQGSMVSKISVENDSFLQTPQLLRLQASFFNRLLLCPDSFAGLTQLIDVRLVCCGLSRVPSALKGVQRTLRHLDIGGNTYLRINKAGNDILLSLSALETLDLSKGKREQFDYCTMKHMSVFLVAWQSRHPGVKVPILTFDNYARLEKLYL